MKHRTNPIAATRRSRSPLGRTASAVGVVIALSGVWHSSASGLTSTDLPAPTAIEPLADPIKTEFGLVQYDDRDSACGHGVELAYVVNRIIVQADAPFGTVKSAINNWISTAPVIPLAAESAGTVSALHGLAAPKASKVDQIVLPAASDDDPNTLPVWAFAWPGGRRDVVDLARQLRHRGWLAAPDYVNQLNDGHNIFRPDGIPQPSTALPVQRISPVAGPAFGAGVRVHVYDSGLAGPANASLMANVRRFAAVDVEVPDRLHKGRADFDSVGHGRAISSLVATLSPGAEVWNARVTRSGISTDFSSAKRLVATFSTPQNTWPDLLVTSFGTQACDLVPDAAGDEIFPVSLHAASETVNRLSDANPADAVDMLIVASAGNHSTSRKEYPAGFSANNAVVSVGALDATLDPDGNPLSSTSRTAPLADFSAYGDWVDFYAPGEAIVTLHVMNITFRLVDETGTVIDQTFIDGKAAVNGTSFSAPMVAALIAGIMSDRGVGATQAAILLRNSGATPIVPCDGTATSADLGPGKAVALVGPNAKGDAPATGAPQWTCP